MEPYILRLAEITEKTLEFVWFPLLVWTLFSGIIWWLLRISSRIHPQYQYHGRLALLYSLPAGLLLPASLQGTFSFLFPGSPSETLKIVTLRSPIEITAAAPESSVSLTATDGLFAGIALLFAGGMLYLLYRFTVQWNQLRRLKNNIHFILLQNTGDLDTVNQQLAAGHSRPIRVAFLNDAVVPVTFGFRNPVILLPVSLRNDPEKFNLAVRHELVHIRQKDFITHALILTTQMLFWFHPLVHLFKKELVEYREMRCDSMVLAGKQVSRKKYASLLLELLPMPSLNKELSVPMAQESSNLKKRIQMIAQQNLNKPVPGWSSLGMFTAIILTASVIMACTDMQTQEAFDNEEGRVENPKVIRGIGGGADEEALRVVSQARFKPGMQRGKPVRVQYSMPILFRLERHSGDETPEEFSDSPSGSPRPQIEHPEVIEQSLEIELSRSGNKLTGTVTDARSGAPLAGANIFLEGSNTGTVSDVDGEFTINSARLDDYSSVHISFVGYGTTEVSF